MQLHLGGQVFQLLVLLDQTAAAVKQWLPLLSLNCHPFAFSALFSVCQHLHIGTSLPQAKHSNCLAYYLIKVLLTFVLLFELFQKLCELVLELRKLKLLQSFDDVFRIHRSLVVGSAYFIGLGRDKMDKLGAAVNHQVHCGSRNA